jgi:hypothetical protein
MFRSLKWFLPIFLIGAGFSEARAQNAQKTASGSVSGQIKIGERGAPGIAVALTSVEARGGNTDTSARVVTDGEGRYTVSNLAAGRYRLNVLAPGYVISGSNSLVRVDDGQSLGGIDYVLTKGAVITGRVTAHGDRPVIGEPVTLIALDETGQPMRSAPGNANNFRTDDRGIYRIYGIAAGKYLVSVGRGGGFNQPGPGGGFGNGSRMWQRTYYPDALEITQATAVEVDAGREITGIDIRMAAVDTYAVAGRVVDAETGNPIGGVLIGHGQIAGRGNPGDGRARRVVAGGGADGVSNPEGEFRIDGLKKGDYAVYLAQDQAAGQNEFYSEPVGFTVSGQDVSGIEVKLRRAASVNGAVVFEGLTDPSVIANLQNFTVRAQIRGGPVGDSGLSMINSSTSQVSSNGSFRVSGLSPGLVSLNISDRRAPGPFSGLTILRIERNGADLKSGLRVESGEQVTGVRIVVAYGGGVVRGFVKVEGGALTPNMRLMVFARRMDVSRSADGGMGGGMPAQVDSNGRFQIERLVAGTYEISVRMMGGMGRPGPGQGGRSDAATQTIVVGGNSAQDIVIPINLAALTEQQGNQPERGRSGRMRGGRP